jgi:hypothetical protein
MRLGSRKENTMKNSLAAIVLLLAPGALAGQMQAGATASSYGVAVRAGAVNVKSLSVVAPADGTLAQDQGSTVTVATFVTAQDGFVMASGDGSDPADAFSSATLGTVSILNGLITADGVVAMASSTGGDSNAAGSSLANLVVNGVQMSDPAPNTRVELAGVGYAILNEQVTTSNGITVNMIHVVLQQRVLAGYVTTGEIVVGSASSSVN